MTVPERVLAHVLPPVGGKHHAECAGVAVWYPGELSTVPCGVFQGGICSRLLHQPTDRVRHAVPLIAQRAPHGLRGLAVCSCCRWFGKRHRYALSRCHCVIHLAGQSHSSLSVLCCKAIGVCNHSLDIAQSILDHPRLHQRCRPVIDARQFTDVLQPVTRRYLHRQTPLSGLPTLLPGSPGP